MGILYKQMVLFLAEFVSLYELFRKPIFFVDGDKFCDIIIARNLFVGDFRYVC